MASAKSFVLPFLKKEKIAKDTFSFYFDRRNIQLDFMPGQYIHMTLPHKHADTRGTTRFFTIASSPLEKKHLMITTKIIKSTFKKSLAALVPGTPITFFGPSGKVILDEKDTTERVFLSGNIGITPFRSMLSYATAKKLSIPLTLIACFAKGEEKVFYEELHALHHPKRRIIYEVGHLSEKMIKKHVADIKKPLFYVIGPPVMVSEITTTLAKIGVAEESILKEEFIDY